MHSSQTVRRAPPAMNSSEISPRSRRRPQTSQTTTVWLVVIVLRLAGIRRG
jgi:hypothetical protein